MALHLIEKRDEMSTLIMSAGEPLNSASSKRQWPMTIKKLSLLLVLHGIVDISQQLGIPKISLIHLPDSLRARLCNWPALCLFVLN